MFLIFFCASHLTNNNRCHYLEDMIQSVINQKLKIPMFISLSYEKELESKVLLLIEEYFNHFMIKIFIHNFKKSQFEHYSFLSTQIPELLKNKTWVIFTDDDDFNHPLRSQSYYEMIKNNHKENSILYQNYLRLYDCGIIRLNHTIEQCDKYLTDGISGTRVCNGLEYWLFSVKLSFLIQFCHIMIKHDILKTHMCDVIFGSLLNKKTLIWKTGKQWIYAYSSRYDRNQASIKYNLEYYKKTYKYKLFKDLCYEFKINNWLGETSLFPNYKMGFFRRLFKY